MGMVFGSIDVERAKFDVVTHGADNGYEIRRYHPAVAVSTTQEPMFSNLAKYIGVFGEPQNRNRSKV